MFSEMINSINQRRTLDLLHFRDYVRLCVDFISPFLSGGMLKFYKF